MSLVARLNKALAGEFFRNVATIASGTAFAQGVGFLTTIVISYLYDKSSIDTFAVYSSIFFVFNTPMGLRYEQAVPITGTDEEAVDTVWLSVLSTGGLTLIILILTWIFSLQLSASLKSPMFQVFPWITPLMLVGAGLFQDFSAWCTRTREFKSQAFATGIQAIATTGFQILPLFIWPHQGWILIVGFAIGKSIGWYRMFSDFRRHSAFHWPDFGTVKSLAARYRQFPALSAPGCVANAAGLQVPAPLLNAYYPAGSATDFFYGSRVLGLPMSLLGAAVSQAYAGEAARVLRERPSEFLKLFDRTISRLGKAALVMLPVGALVALALRFVIHNPGNAPLWTLMLIPSFCLSLVCSPISVTSSLVEKLKTQFYFDIGRSALTISAFVVPHLMRWNNTTAVAIYAVVMTATYVVYILLYRGMAAEASKRKGLSPYQDIETVELVRAGDRTLTKPLKFVATEELKRAHPPESTKKRILKKLIQIVVAKPLRFIAPLLGFDRKYLTGRHFDDHVSGWRMLIRAIFFQKLFGFNRSCRFPISHQSACQNGGNLIFHPDDFNNLWHFGCYYQNFSGKIFLGRGTYIAPNVGIITANHDPEDLDVHLPGKDVVIGKNCWIGMNAMILPGVILGDNTVVAAGAVVTKSFPEGHCVLAGVPAKIVKVNERKAGGSNGPI